MPVIVRGFLSPQRIVTKGYGAVTTARLTAVANSILAILDGLTLDGSPTVQQFELPNLRAAAGAVLPSIQVTKPPAAEREVGSGIRSDTWELPILLTGLKATDQALAWDDQLQGWREAVIDALHHQRQTALPLVFTCESVPKEALDPSVFQLKNVSLWQIIVRARWKRVRSWAAPSPSAGTGARLTSAAALVQSVVAGLSLTCFTGAQVLRREVFDLRAATGANPPCVVVSKAAQTAPEATAPVGTNAADDWRLPVLVTLVKASDQYLGWDDDLQIDREAVIDAFHNKAVAGSPSDAYCWQVEPQKIIDPQNFQQRNLSVSQLLIRAKWRHTRT